MTAVKNKFCLLLTIVLCFWALQIGLFAQVNKSAEKPFRFDLPLKPNILTSYKITERVRTIIKLPAQKNDTTERVINYYFTGRPVLTSRAADKGKIIIEFNIDSMNINHIGATDTLKFNTQNYSDAQSKKVSHTEIFAPTLPVNRPVKIFLSPYGELLSMESEEYDMTIKQLKETPGFDELNRARCIAYLQKEYTAPTFLPWKLFTPIGRALKNGGSAVLNTLSVLDRTVFKGSVKTEFVQRGDSTSSTENHLILSGSFDKPITNEITLLGFDKPLKIDYANAKLTGDITLENGGGVLSGWTSSTGTITTAPSFGGIMQVNILHETYINKIGTESFAVDDRVKEEQKKK